MMQDTKEKPSRAIVAAVQLSSVSDAEFESSLAELRQRAALVPRRQIWCRSALPWSASLAGLPGIERQ